MCLWWPLLTCVSHTLTEKQGLHNRSVKSPCSETSSGGGAVGRWVARKLGTRQAKQWPPPPPNSWSLSGTLPNSFETQSAAHARCVKWKLQAGWEELHDSQWCCTQRVLLWVIDDNIYQLIIINEMAGIVNIHSGSIGYSFRCIHSWCRPIHPLNRMNIINTEHEALKSVFYLLIKSAKALRIWVLSLSTILWSFFGSIELHFTFVVPVI